MGVNVVSLANGETIVDMTGANITPETVLAGYIGYGADGDPVVGTMKPTVQRTASVLLHRDRWVDGVQTVDVDFVTAEAMVFEGGEPRDQEYLDCGVWCSGKEDGRLTFSCIYEPYEDVYANIGLLLSGGLVISYSHGSVISLNDSSDRKLRGLTIYGKTTQDGTPTPGNPVELVSAGDGGSVGVTVAGKNLLADGNVYTGGLDQSYGSISVGNPVTSPVNRAAWAGVGVRARVFPNTTYTISSDITPCRYFTVTFYKNYEPPYVRVEAISFIEFGNKNSVAFTTPEDCYCVVITSVNNAESDFTWSWWQLELGSTATAYEPQKGQTLTVSTPNGLPGIPVTSGGNYTDANGQQWVCDEVDLGRGKYVQRVFRIPLDAEIFNKIDSKAFPPYNISYTLRTVGGRTTLTLSGFPSIAGKNGTGQAGTVMMSNFTNVVGSGASGKCVMWENGTLNTYQHNIAFNTEYVSATTKEAFIEFFTEKPGEILTGMPEPIETDLTAEQLAAYAALHTNYPNTTIYNDAGAGMAVRYVVA